MIRRGNRFSVRIQVRKNLIKLDKASQSYKKLCRIAMDTSLEVQRRVVARLHGREFPRRPNQSLVDTSGQAQEFMPLRNHATDVPASYNLTSLMNRYVLSIHRVRSEKTRKSLRGYLETTAAILGPGKDIRTVTHADCLRAREVIEKLPPSFKKLRQFDGLPVEQIAEIAQRDGMSMLSPQGVNNYVDAFYGFLRWCEGSQFIDRLPARRELLRVADPEKREEKRLPFTDEQLQIIFSTGAFETRDRTSSMFWVPLIALWNGMRSNEICQLDVEDIREGSGVWCFDITSVSATGGSDKTTKTESSIRVLPIHPKLKELGFVDFRNGRPGGAKLFSDLKLGADGYYSSVFSKRINRHFHAIGVHTPRKRVFHSLRHNFRDKMRRAEIDPGVARALGGWTNKNSEAFEIYGRGYTLTHLSDAINRIEYQMLDINHLRRR